ncbi:MAG TPA: RES family NAD+ phosphorylase [Pyrinomonadaceae bacterium]|jgi:RES domain-containing protein
MPVNSGLTTTVLSGQTYYRITSVAYKTSGPMFYRRIVNGRGAVKSLHGARYNFPGAVTVYLADDLETCLAEKMFYFHREVVKGIDLSHLIGVLPPFEQSFILWEIELTQEVEDVFDLTIPGAHSYFNIFPSLPLNPSQDYEHLKKSRAVIENSDYKGIKVESSRVTTGGNLIVLFEDQSSNVQSITPYEIKYRLITTAGTPFYNHATEILDFTAGDVMITDSSLPSGGGGFKNWRRVDFNH